MELQVLCIAGTEDTPEISFVPELNVFTISGRSLPEDVSSFYSPVFDWLGNFSEYNTGKAVFRFKLEYFNTASSKIILDILMRLEEQVLSSSTEILVEWYHAESDDDMMEAGQEYKELVEVPFNLVSY